MTGLRAVLAENRRPLGVLGLCAVLATVLFAVGAVQGSRSARQGPAEASSSPADHWLRGLDRPPVPLLPADLPVSHGTCVVEPDGLRVTELCVLSVPEGRGLALRSPTRRIRLSLAGGGPPATVEATVTVDGRPVPAANGPETIPPPDRALEFRFGSEGGSITLACATCLVTFT